MAGRTLTFTPKTAICELIRALELGRHLAPIVVMRIGKKLFVVDGHHRLAAYAAQGKTTVSMAHLRRPTSNRLI